MEEMVAKNQEHLESILSTFLGRGWVIKTETENFFLLTNATQASYAYVGRSQEVKVHKPKIKK